MKYLKLLSWIIAGTLMFSCGQPKQSIELTQHFDLKNFFVTETERLSNLRTVSKQITYNDQSETKIDSSFSIVDKLSLFEKADINRVALIGKYTIDSVLTTDQKLEAVLYRSISKSLKPQKLSVFYNENEEADRIEIEQRAENWINQNEQELKYEAKKGYSIRTRQAGFFGESEQLIQITFAP